MARRDGNGEHAGRSGGKPRQNIANSLNLFVSESVTLWLDGWVRVSEGAVRVVKVLGLLVGLVREVKAGRRVVQAVHIPALSGIANSVGNRTLNKT